ncbi:MAG TPA: DUF5668 domain-containing protein [Candidatus Saccharimonadales bacterium]|nr:DUF5668 domain-containing protein [Candidatus Saccharimonadales bacterium]
MKSQITRFTAGLGIIVIGVVLLLANLDVAGFDEIARNGWPAIIIGVGILMFINDTKNYLWALLISGVGVALQLRELDIVTVNIFQLFWPAVIVIIGLSIIFNRAGSAKRVSKEKSDDVSAILGGIDHRNNSENYLGGQATAIMGGIKIDLRGVKIKEQATLNVFAFWGGVELIVPSDIVVKTKASCILGGIENKTNPETSKGAPVLYVTGDVIMAGVEIKN